MKRLTRALAVAALSFGVVVVAAGQQPPKEEMKDKPGMDKMMKGGAGKQLPKLEVEAASQDAVYFSADGPVRVRFVATIDGRPAEDLWREAVDRFYTFCDKNKDGTLDAKERAIFRRQRQEYQYVDQDGNVYGNATLQVTFTEDKGKVDRSAFRAGFRNSGLSPVNVAMKATQSKTGQMTDALFTQLDADKDGKLTVAELKAASGRLAALDVNEDEVVTSQELLGRGYGNNFGQYFVTQTFLNGRAKKETVPGDFAFPVADAARAAKDILAAYDKNKDDTLNKDELASVMRLDKDANGKVTEAELAAWLRTPPDLEFKLEFGEAKQGRTWFGQALDALGSVARPAEVASSGLVLVTKGGLAAKTKAEDNGDVTLVLPDARLRFSANKSQKAQLVANWNAQVENVKTQFKTLAGDKKSIDKKQFNENPNLAQAADLFDFGDQNGDGRLELKEIEAAIAVLAPLVGCRADVSVSDQGRGLFELIDPDGDGRLSPRELVGAHAVVAALDRNKNGLEKVEVPKVYAVASSVASAQAVSLNPYAFDGVVFGSAGYAPTGAKSVSAPEWFQKMDRNGDGDLSRREFLGPTEMFQKFDKDGDGLVSPDEARAAEPKPAEKSKK